MRIRFLVAGMGFPPSGGLRIVYEHANRLCERGHSVEIVHIGLAGCATFKSRFRAIRYYLRHRLLGANARRWIEPHSKLSIKHVLTTDLADLFPDEIIVATYYSTHSFLTPSILSAHRCFYLIQGVEAFTNSRDVHCLLWKAPSTNIVISKWLKREVEHVSGKPALFVPNAIDQTFFKSREDRLRSRFTLLFYSCNTPEKGTFDLISALNALDLEMDLVAFGRDDPAKLGLNKPCEFHQSPPQDRLRDLYCEAHVFVSASHGEGWGLTVAEATACGAAVIVSDIPGHHEFLSPEGSALFFPVKDVASLKDCITSLGNNKSDNSSLVANAQKDLSPYNWSIAADAMETALSADAAE